MEAIAKPLHWIGSSKRDLMDLPVPVRKSVGLALKAAQFGERPESAKTLKGFGGAGVLELIESDAGGTYRAVYTVRFQQAVFVLHCFQKKSKTGIATPQREIEIVKRRIKVAEELAKELSREDSHNPRY